MLRSRLDRAFVRYARTGDPAALARVFDGCAPELYRIGFHLLGDRHAAEDLVQQTFVVAIEEAKGFDGSRRVLPWLCGILTHRALHARRQARVRASAAASANANANARDDVVDPVAASAANETHERVAAAVRSLPEPYRQVLLLHLVHELSPKEVAEALARPDATVRTQLARGLERLRKLLPVGIAGVAMGQVPVPIGLAAVRAAVLARAAHGAPVAAATAAAAGGIAFTGVVVMKKMLLAFAALIAAIGVWSWWCSQPALPTGGDARGPVAASVEPQRVPMPSATTMATAPNAGSRTAAPEVLDPSAAALDVLVQWHDGTPAADIPVRVRPRLPDYERWLRVASTGDDGVARFVGLQPGHANALTGRGTKADVDLVAGTRQRTTITLDKGIDVRGRVVDLDAKPVAGATVWLSVARSSDDSEPVAVTAADGAFLIRGAGGGFVLTASAAGLGCARSAVVEAKVQEIVLTLRPAPGALSGTVVDEAGRPVAGARLLLGVTIGRGENSRLLGRIVGQDLWPSRFLRADANGRFRSEGLPALPWPLWAGGSGFAPSFQVVDVRADRETEVVICLGQGATVRGRVTDASAAGVAGVVISALPDLPAPHELIGLGMGQLQGLPSWVHMKATTGVDGSYLLPRVLPGKVTLLARRNPEGAKIETELVNGQTFVWDAQLAPLENPTWRRFEGALVDEGGQGLVGWVLRVGHPQDRRIRATPYDVVRVGDDGAFQTDRVAPGSYRLFVQPRDPLIGDEVDVGEFDVANCPLRVVVPRAHVPTARVRGRIVVPAGALATRCHVTMSAEARRPVRVACDENASYVVGPVQSGRYVLQVESRDFGEVRFGPIDVADGRDVDAGAFQMPTPGTLVVRMVDAAGSRVPDAWVVVRPIGDDRRGGSLEHRDGTARGNLPSGRWLVFTRNLATLAAMEAEVRAGETTEVRFVIPEGVPYLLRLPAAAREHERARLEWRDANGALVREAEIPSFAIGKDQELRAPAGRYTLEVIDPSGAKATTSFELRAGAAPPIVEVPLPAK